MNFLIMYFDLIVIGFKTYFIPLTVGMYVFIGVAKLIVRFPIDWELARMPLVLSPIIILTGAAIPFPFLFVDWLTGRLVIPQ